MSKLEEMFHRLSRTPSDINLHLPTLMNLVNEFPGMEGPRVVEMGTRHGHSTVALLMGHPSWLITYDIDPKWDDFKTIKDAWEEHTGRNNGLEFRQEDTTVCDILECDILFIDTLHTGQQLSLELDRHHKKVRHYLCFHDMTSFGLADEAPVRQYDKNYHPGLLPAIFDFLQDNREWDVEHWDPRCNGLLVLKRRGT